MFFDAPADVAQLRVCRQTVAAQSQLLNECIHGRYDNELGVTDNSSTFRVAKKFADFTTPGPTQVYILIDEH